MLNDDDIITLLPAVGLGYPGHEVHEEGEEGEGRGQQRLLVKELDQVVQPRIPAHQDKFCTRTLIGGL